MKVNQAGNGWAKANVCKDAQAFVWYGWCGCLLVIITYLESRVRLSHPVNHLVCDEIEAVVPRLCATSIRIG